MQKTIEQEQDIQDVSNKFFESRVFSDGEEVTVLDVRVREIFDVSGRYPVVDFETDRHSITAYVRNREIHDTFYYADDVYAAQKPEYSKLTLSCQIHEDNLPENYVPASGYTPLNSSTMVFDSEGQITEEPSVFKRKSKHQVEIDISTSFGSKTITKKFRSESNANEFRKRIQEEADHVELQLDDTDGPILRLTDSVEQRQRIFSTLNVILLFVGLFVPAISLFAYLLGYMSLGTFVGAFLMSLLFTTLPTFLVAMCPSVDDFEESVEPVLLENEVEKLDVQAEELEPKTFDMTVTIEDGQTKFSVVDELISWTFGATNGYPSSEAVEFAEYIGIEKIDKDVFTVDVIPSTRDNSEQEYLSDCGVWIAQSG